MRARAFVAAAVLTGAVVGQTFAAADVAQLERGKYLVRVAGCTDCHTPGHFLGKPDLTKALAGSDVGFFIPNLGTFVGPNLTSDKETGLGKWTSAQIATALRAGLRPDGRSLAPSMPYMAYAGMTTQDIDAIVAYLQSLPPIKNKVAGPFKATEEPTVLALHVVPPKAAAPK